jgi:tRNA (adenine22-N1)-methyltransferase
MRFTLRFEKILSFVRPHHVLYDLCCDHGLMGLKALVDCKSAKVHFVDQSENALQAIRSELKLLPPDLQSKARVHCMPAERCVNLDEPSDFIIAGVGISTCISIISELFPAGLANHRLILAPQQKSQVLRKFLIEKDFRLVDETVTIERQRFREIIVVEAKGEAIDLYGHRFRSRLDADSKAFVQHLTDYYKVIDAKKVSNKA